MSDRELVTFDAKQFEQIHLLLSGENGALNKLADRIAPAGQENSVSVNVTKWLSTINDAIKAQTETIKQGFADVATAIANLQPLPPPQPKMRGTIMADYSIPDNTPDGRVTFNLAATDEEGAPITDPAILAGLGFTAESSNPDAFTVTLDADQPDPTKRVGGYHVGAPGQAAVTGNLTDADGNLIGTGTDGFTVTTGKVALGSVTSQFDGLTPIGA